MITKHGEIDDALTIVVPTIGRDSLQNTLDSIKSQIRQFDQVFVVADGTFPHSQDLVRKYGIQFGYFNIPDGPHNDWGARARNYGMSFAKKAYISFMDDDDEYLPGAFEAIKNAVHEFPGQPFMFRMKHGDRTIWNSKEIKMNNVSSQMVVVPNDQGRLGQFTDRYEGDFDFIRSTADLYFPDQNPYIWREETIAVLFKANGKPHENPLSALELPPDF